MHRKALFLSLIALLMTNVWMAWALPKCQGNDPGKWHHCHGSHTKRLIVSEFRNGTYSIPYYTTYIGEWENGKADGQGSYTNHKGDKYFGEFRYDKFHGRGAMHFVDGTTWIGLWRDGEWVNGDKYGAGQIPSEVEIYASKVTPSLENRSSGRLLRFDIEAGRNIAEKNCGSCHLTQDFPDWTAGVAKDMDPDASLSFEAIANHLDMESLDALKAELKTSHWPDTGNSLSSTDIDNLVGYILGFANK